MSAEHPIDFDAAILPEPAIIPDSIEPVLGYKALNISPEDGTLWSPSESGIQWPVGRKLQALCTRDREEWGWLPVEGEEPEWMPGAGSKGSPKPTNPLPPGWHWHWALFQHAVPDEDCTCGIYVVDDPARCLSYLHDPNGVIVQVALWGTVVPGDKGARGQYAYPKCILTPQPIVDAVRPTAALYGVPMVLLEYGEEPAVEAPPPPKRIVPNPHLPSAVHPDVFGQMLQAGQLPPIQPGHNDPAMRALLEQLRRGQYEY